jgi:hypothetical protein
MRAIVVLTGLLLLVLALPAEAQKKKGKCTGEPADSALLVGGPVFRDCEVDRAARIRGQASRLNFTPPASGVRDGRCYRAEFQLVVDTLGQAELATVRPRLGNDRDLEEAVRMTLPGLVWEPARLEGRAVRQVVVYKMGVVTRVRVTSSNGAPVGLPPIRPSTVGC